MRKTDISNNRFGKLLAVKRVENKIYNCGQVKHRWLFACDCGEKKEILKHSVTSGNTSSCGCVYREDRKIHGMHKHYMYKIYHAMKSRCTNKTNKAYKNYGGRGLSVSDAWANSFETFYKDMGERPAKGYSIERIDNNKGYSKENCDWANSFEQNSNQRNSIKHEFLGKSVNAYDLGRFSGINPSTIACRLKKGMNVYMVITKPVRKNEKRK